MQSQSIGPYRIEDQLGAGGMGEVYRAYDERLERRVALKLIRPEALANAEVQQRFVREARAAAGLSHSSIVQIHDILEREEGPCIVMELIEGETLASLLRSGPLPLGRALPLARQIAEGLAEAHDHGIVHRDLKAGNVMITPAGHAKILDFGLAKRLAHGDTELTASGGGILGTCHAMSPEQAQGSRIDHRSDLFSLGVLLYEATTGQRPFRGGSPLEILRRVVTYQQPSARELNPEIPEALSVLIDQLLEKDPVLRPHSTRRIAATLGALAESARGESSSSGQGPTIGRPPASEDEGRRIVPMAVTDGTTIVTRRPRSGRRRVVAGAGVALLLVLAGLAALLLRSRQAESLYVAVPPPEIDPKVEVADPDLVASAVRVALVQGLQALAGISPLALDEVDAVAGTSAQVARALAADEVVSARLESCARQTCRVRLSRVRGSDGSVPWIRSVDVPINNLLSLSNMIRRNLTAGYPGRRSEKDPPNPAVRPEDYKEYLQLRRSFVVRQENTSPDQLLERLEAIQETSRHFPEAYILEAQIAHDYFSMSRDPAYLERALRAIEEARDLAPEDPQPLFNLFTLLLAKERLAEAEEVLSELDRLRPGDATVLVKRALLAERRGDPRQGLVLMRTAADRHPSWSNLVNLARMEDRQGDIAEARRLLEASLELSPDNFRSQSSLARLELLSGRAERAIELYDGLLRRSSGIGELLNLGLAYLVAQRYQEAAERFRQVLEREPRSRAAIVDLAHAEALLGNSMEAKALCQRVLELTPGSDGHSLLIRAQALAYLEQPKPTAAAVRDGLALLPDSPWAVFDAALVYALIGDRFSALANAERALELRVAPGWLAMPWFDSLRSDPEFRQLLRTAAEADPE